MSNKKILAYKYVIPAGIKLETCEARIKALHLITVHLVPFFLICIVPSLWCEAETNIHLSQVQFQLYFAV